jgi:hypothetical protein
MLVAQGGGCAICGSTDTKGPGQFFAVDHCHETGAVRGLLCLCCNTALGQLGDDVDLLRRAIDYLNRTRG